MFRIPTPLNISLNTLCAYLPAGPERRRRVIELMRSPTSAVTGRYAPARAAIMSQLMADPDGSQVLDRALADLSTLPNPSQDDRLSVLALRSWKTIDRPRVGGRVRFTRAPRHTTPLRVGRLGVLLRPELLVSTSEGEIIGATLLYLVKSEPLDASVGELAAMLLQDWAERNVAAQRGTDRARCMVIDVFGERVFRSPRRQRRRRLVLDAVVEELSMRLGVSALRDNVIPLVAEPEVRYAGSPELRPCA